MKKSDKKTSKQSSLSRFARLIKSIRSHPLIAVGVFIATIIGVASGILTISSYISAKEKDKQSVKIAQDIADIKARMDRLNLSPQQQQDYVEQSGVKRDELKQWIIKSEIDPTKKQQILDRIERHDLKNAISLFRTVFKGIPNKALRIRSQAAYFIGTLYYLDLDFNNALAWYEKAVSIDPQNLEYANLIGRTFLELGHIDKAIITIDGALRNVEPKNSADYIQIATAHNNLGSAYLDLDYPRESIAHLEQALKLAEEHVTGNSQIIAYTLDNLSNAYAMIGRMEDAISTSDRAIAALRLVLGNDHPELAVALNNSAIHYMRINDLQKAVSRSADAVQIIEKYPNHPDYPSILDNCGLLNRMTGNLSVAKNYSLQALAASIDFYGTNHPTTATVYNNLGMISLDEQNPKDAIVYFQDALSISRTLYGDSHMSSFVLGENLVRAYMNAGQHNDAKALLLRMIRTANRTAGLDKNYTQYLEKWLDDYKE